MKQCGHYSPSTAESASIINAPYKCLSQRIKELKDKWKALIMKGEAFSATNGSWLLNMHHTGKCWRLQEYYHLSHPSAQRERRLVTEFSNDASDDSVRFWFQLYWWKWLQSPHRHLRASQTLLGGALQWQDRFAAGREQLCSQEGITGQPTLKDSFSSAPFWRFYNQNNQPLSTDKNLSYFLPPLQ